MPNAVKFATVTPPGSIRKGAVALGLTGNLGPTGTTAWYNGITPQPGKYIIYDVLSITGRTLIYAPQNLGELTRLALQLGATSGDVVSEGAILSWFDSQAFYAIVNKNYPDIITDNLVYAIDSTYIPSYPTTGTTTYPIADTVAVGTGNLQNGVGFNSSAGAFIFDGSDDQIPLATSDNFSNAGWTNNGVTLMVLYKIDAVTDFNGQFRCMIGVTGGNRSWNYYLYGPTNPATTLLYHFSGQMSSGLSSAVTVTSDTYHLGLFTIVNGSLIGTYYHDGVVVSTQAAQSNPDYTTAGGTQYIGRGDNFWKGNIAKVMIYNKALTQAEIYQTYYQGNIVTSGLVFAVDAGNLISYPATGTSTTNLTGSRAIGTLTNGTSFTSDGEGAFVFDGTNDYISFPNDTSLDSQAITMESWSNVNSIFQDGFLFEKGAVNTQYSNFYNSDGTFYFRTMGLSTQDLTFYIPSYIAVNTWNHIVCTYSSGTKAIYVNGVQVAGQTGLTGTISTNSSGLYVGAYGVGSGYFINGEIAVSRVYNKALTAQEVNQNFSAQSSRFLAL